MVRKRNSQSQKSQVEEREQTPLLSNTKTSGWFASLIIFWWKINISDLLFGPPPPVATPLLYMFEHYVSILIIKKLSVSISSRSQVFRLLPPKNYPQKDVRLGGGGGGGGGKSTNGKDPTSLFNFSGQRMILPRSEKATLQKTIN